MTQTVDRGWTNAAQFLLAASLLAVAGCGGGGGGGSPAPAPAPAPAPGPAPITLSGTITIAETAAVDSDTNDVNQAGYVRNDDLGIAQPLASPVLLVGTVNLPRTGPAGRNFTAGDDFDVYSLELSENQVVELEFAEDPALGDLDLFLIGADERLVGASNGVASRFECIRVTRSGTYFVAVEAFSGASIYSLRVGAPGSTPTCANAALSVDAFVPGEVLATPRPGAADRPRERAQVAGGLTEVGRLPTTGTQRLRMPPQASQQREGLQALRAAAPRERTPGAATPAPKRDAGALARGPAQAQALATLRYAKALRATGAWQDVHPNWKANSLQSAELVQPFPPNDRLYSYQRWHYEQINLPSAIGRIDAIAPEPTQRPVVAVIDTGVALDHPDIAAQLFSNGRSFLDSGAGNSASGDDTSPPGAAGGFHGTHVAGTVAARTYDGIGGAGVAPMAQILPLRVLGNDGSGTLFDILEAIQYAARLSNGSGTLPARRADVINLSLGSDRACSTAEQALFAQVRDAGVIVVAAAGNSGRNEVGQRADVGAPANCNDVIAVSALDARKQLTGYSNTGTAIDVAAPGGDTSQSTTGSGAPDGVYSDLATFDAANVRQPSFGPLQGTSMASPHVAGVMALMRYVNPAITPAQIETLLANGSLTDDLGSAGRDIDFGHGLINARKAVDAALAAGGGGGGPVAGVVVASPFSLDFGTRTDSLVFDLQATAATAETVASVISDSAALTVSPTTIDAAGLGRYTVTVDRNALAGDGPFFPTITVALSPTRTFTIAVSVGKPGAGGSNASASYGPIYVLLIDPATDAVLTTVLAQPVNGRYQWTSSGFTGTQVTIVAGGDLDNDDIVCQRGEPCGGYPVLKSGGETPVIPITGARADLDFEVAPLTGISAQSVAARAAGFRKGPIARPVASPGTTP